MQDWDDNNWIEFFEKLFNFINKHEELKDQANVRKLV